MAKKVFAISASKIQSTGTINSNFIYPADLTYQQMGPHLREGWGVLILVQQGAAKSTRFDILDENARMSSVGLIWELCLFKNDPLPKINAKYDPTSTQGLQEVLVKAPDVIVILLLEEYMGELTKACKDAAIDLEHYPCERSTILTNEPDPISQTAD